MIRQNHINKMREYENKHKQTGVCLNLGSGQTHIKGYTNLDYNKNSNPDIVWNLNNYPYPFTNGKFDFIYCSHILEHVEDFFKCFKELNRILKIEGKIHIRVPHFSNYLAYTDLTHKRFFGYTTFIQLIENKEYNLDFTNFKIEKIRLNYTSCIHEKLNKFLSFLPNKFPFIYERLFTGIYPVFEIEILLKKEKK